MERLRQSTIGGPPCDSHRDSSIDTAIGNVAYAATDISVRRWYGSAGHVDEVPVWTNAARKVRLGC